MPRADLGTDLPGRTQNRTIEAQTGRADVADGIEDLLSALLQHGEKVYGFIVS
jgi:hypothetical protein